MVYVVVHALCWTFSGFGQTCNDVCPLFWYHSIFDALKVLCAPTHSSILSLKSRSFFKKWSPENFTGAQRRKMSRIELYEPTLNVSGISISVKIF